MKNLTAALCALAACGGAYAQSTVTIFGAADMFLNSAKSGPTSYTRLKEGGNAASRLGFRGTEDLGGGLKANFMLEGGISMETGAGNIPGPGFTFSRQSYLGLSNTWGVVEMGRMYTPMFNAIVKADPFSVNSVFSPQNLIATADGQTGFKAFNARASSMIRYRSAPEQPLMVDVGYSFGEELSPNQNNGNIISGTVGWNKKPYYIAYAVQKRKERSSIAPHSTSTYQSINAGYYLSSNLRVMGNYYRNSVNLPNIPIATITNLAVDWYVTPTSRVMASIARRELSGSPRGQLAWTLGYDYALSKRTALYARWLQSDNKGNSSVSLAQVPVAANSGDGVRSIGVGVRHSF